MLPLPVAVAAQGGVDVDLTIRNWSTKGTCKIIFFVYSILASPKKASYFFF
jgi:hypothetical protein